MRSRHTGSVRSTLPVWRNQEVIRYMRSLTRKRISAEWVVLAVLVVVSAIVGLNNVYRSKPQITSNPTKLSSLYRQEREEANVTVSVEYLPDQTDPRETTIEVVLDTHSINLDEVNFSQDVVIEKNGKVIKPIRTKEEGSGHHRKAQISFPKTPFPFIIVVSNVSTVTRREFKFQ